MAMALRFGKRGAPLMAREGRDQVQRALAGCPVMAAPGGLAVDGDHLIPNLVDTDPFHGGGLALPV